MKQRQRAHLDSIRRKRDTAQHRDDVDRRRGGTESEKEGDNASWTDVNFIRPKNEKINTIISTGTNER
jgi:hypothetical protein